MKYETKIREEIIYNTKYTILMNVITDATRISTKNAITVATKMSTQQYLYMDSFIIVV